MDDLLERLPTAEGEELELVKLQLRRQRAAILAMEREAIDEVTK